MTRDAAMVRIRDLPARLFHWVRGAGVVPFVMHTVAISFYALNRVQKSVARVAWVIANALPRVGA